MSVDGSRRFAGAAVSLVLGGAILAFLLQRVSAAEIVAAFRRADPALLVATLAMGLAVTAVRTLRFGLFFPAPSGRRLDLYGVFAFFRILKVAMPFHSGEVAVLALLKRRGLAPTIAETAPVWMLLRVADLAAVSAILAAVLAAVDMRHELEVVRWLLLAGPAGLVAMLLVPGRWIERAAVRGGSGWLGGRLAAAATGLGRARRRGRVLAMLLVTIVMWSMMAATGTLAQLAFASPLRLRECLAAAVVSQAVSMLPIHAPLGIGTDDAVWSGMLAALGMPLEEAIALTVAVRATLIGLVVADGVVGAVCLAVAGRSPRSA